MEKLSRAKLCDIVNLSLGTILFFSPWLFSLSAGALDPLFGSVCGNKNEQVTAKRAYDSYDV